jgi:hypothetical protein
VSRQKYANRYVCHPTDNKSSGAQSSITIGGLSLHPGKSTPLLLCNSAAVRFMANSENVDSLPECDGIGQRNRGAIFF